jgi:hypothetical protein
MSMLRTRRTLVVLPVVFAATACTAPAPATVLPAPSKPIGTLAQVMRGVYFPNANLIFDVQQKDPGAPPVEAKEGSRDSTTAQFSSIYTGWQVVENAAILLAESTDLIMLPGRLCQNGRPVPTGDAQYTKAARGMRDAAVAALEAAKARNLEKSIELTDRIAEGCSNCHETYRDKGDADSPARCTP